MADSETKEQIAGFPIKQYQEIAYDTVTNALGGKSLFDIPDNSDEKNASVRKLKDLSFEFAFKAKVGLPPGALTAIPDVVVLDRGNRNLSYQLFFAEIAITTLSTTQAGVRWGNLRQQRGNPWVFRFDVSLDVRPGGEGAFNQLPYAVQSRLKRLNPDSTFSVQQLYLDLTSAKFLTGPDLGFSRKRPYMCT
jgi:hypothetical protein